jgi:putative addiction module component (TIGR02574 family)
MAHMTAQVSEVLARALQLSDRERGLLIGRLIESLDKEPAQAGTEEAWASEIKGRVDEIRSGKVKMIPGATSPLACVVPASKPYEFHPAGGISPLVWGGQPFRDAFPFSTLPGAGSAGLLSDAPPGRKALILRKLPTLICVGG